MALWGTIVNALAIIAGSVLGILLPRISDSMRNTVMQGLGIAVSMLGIMMTMKSNNFLIVITSLVLGSVIGEWLRIEHRLQQLGEWLERMVNRASAAIRSGKNGKTVKSKIAADSAEAAFTASAANESSVTAKGSISEGFVTGTLVYCIGAMAILGAIDSGLRGDHSILYTKSMLDGFSAIIFASTLGLGVMFSAASVFIYQGIIAIAASFITLFIGESMLNAIITELSAVGGVLIIGIGLNILQIKKINVANMLPSLLIAAIIVPLWAEVSAWFTSLG